MDKFKNETGVTLKKISRVQRRRDFIPSHMFFLGGFYPHYPPLPSYAAYTMLIMYPLIINIAAYEYAMKPNIFFWKAQNINGMVHLLRKLLFYVSMQWHIKLNDMIKAIL